MKAKKMKKKMDSFTATASYQTLRAMDFFYEAGLDSILRYGEMQELTDLFILDPLRGIIAAYAVGARATAEMVEALYDKTMEEFTADCAELTRR